MMHNDTIGDCTCAAAGHLVMEWTANVGAETTPADADILAAYSAITGYDPKTGANDNGAVETDVLNYWRKTGIAGHKIMAYAALEPGNHQPRHGRGRPVRRLLHRRGAARLGPAPGRLVGAAGRCRSATASPARGAATPCPWWPTTARARP